MSEGITFRASFNKATTTIDGGWRVSFDLSKQSGNIAAQLAALDGLDLQIGVIPFEAMDPLEGLNDG